MTNDTFYPAHPSSSSTPSAASGHSLQPEEAREKVAIFSLNQRIGRIRYLAYSTISSLLLMMPLVAVVGMDSMILLGQPEAENLPVSSYLSLGIYYLLSFFVSIVLSVRRLHDLDKSGWFWLLMLVPLVNLGMVIYLVFFPGSEFANRFGAKPEPNRVLTWIAGLLLPIVFVLGIVAAVVLPAYQLYVERAQQGQVEWTE